MGTRNFTISTDQKLGYPSQTDVTDIVLTFAPLVPSKLFTNQYMVAWKIAKLAPHAEITTPTFSYSADLVISSLADPDPKLVTGGNKISVSMGQQATASFKDGVFQWGPVTGDPSTDPFQFTNVSENKVLGVSVGMNNAENVYEAMLAFPQVNVGDVISVEVTPMLRAYAVSNYQATQVIKADLSTLCLGEWNLMKCPTGLPGTNFTVWRDSTKGNKMFMKSSADALDGVRTGEADLKKTLAAETEAYKKAHKKP